MKPWYQEHQERRGIAFPSGRDEQHVNAQDVERAEQLASLREITTTCIQLVGLQLLGALHMGPEEPKHDLVG